MFKDFKAFLLRGNVVDLAVGVILGIAFGGVIAAFTDMVTNLIAIPGSTDFTSLDFTIGGGAFKYGVFLAALINFVIVAAVLFFAVVRPVNHLMARRKTEPEVDTPTKQCPECLSSIPDAATRCAFCTVEQ